MSERGDRMQQTVTLSIPESLAEAAAAEAERTSQSVEDVLVAWLNRGGNEDLGSLPDAELLSVCESCFDDARQQELSDLLERNRETALDERDRNRLQELMGEYQRGNLRKAQALKIAVGRGLKTELG